MTENVNVVVNSGGKLCVRKLREKNILVLDFFARTAREREREKE